MNRRYYPLDGAAKTVAETAGTITLDATSLGVEDVRDYNWVLQVAIGGATTYTVSVRGPNGAYKPHTTSTVDGAIIFISGIKGEFYDAIKVVLTGSTAAVASVWGEERGR